MQGSVNNRIGGSPNCIEDEFFLKGQGRFVSDIIMPRMVHAEFLRSVYANARIVNVDCSEARAMPGVLVILTGEDCRTEILEAFDRLQYFSVKMGPKCLCLKIYR